MLRSKIKVTNGSLRESLHQEDNETCVSSSSNLFKTQQKPLVTVLLTVTHLMLDVSRTWQDEEDDEHDDDDGDDEEDDAGADSDHRSLPVGRKSFHNQQDRSGADTHHYAEEAAGQQAGRTPPRDARRRRWRWLGQEVPQHG